jgi:hypothetical protein
MNAWFWLALAGAVAAVPYPVLHRSARHRPASQLPASQLLASRGRRAPEIDARAAALLLDLLASTLTSGAPPDVGISLVAAAVDEAVEAVEATNRTGALRLHAAMAPLRRVGRLLQLGADPTVAWGELGGLPVYRAAAVAGQRCTSSGARLAGSLRAAVAEIREERRAAALTRAERVGVWSLLPLGLCFLPAFVCIGIGPVIVGVGREVLSGLS